RRAALFLLHNHRAPQAIQLLDRAASVAPGDPGILLLKAAALELSSKTAEAERVLKSIEDRWPEWPKAWAFHALVLRHHGDPEQSRRMMDTATELAPTDPAIRDSASTTDLNRAIDLLSR